MPTPASPELATTEPPLPRTRGRRLAIGAAIAAVAIAVDQATKAWALASLDTDQRIPLLGDAFGLQLAFNSGSAMSFGGSFTWVFTVLASAAVLVLPVLIFRAKSTITAIGLALIWGGAAGNLWDRLFAEPGFGIGRVTDFLAYGNLFIGNLADVFLVVGVGLVLIEVLRASRRGN